MKLQKDDPRLLQFILKEISLADHQIVESAIIAQPEIAAEIQELKRLYGDISAVESKPQNMSLSADRKKALFAQTIHKKSETAGASLFKTWRYVTGGLIAATFGFLIFNQSLKNEVKLTETYKRTTIPADSERGALAGSPPPATESAPLNPTAEQEVSAASDAVAANGTSQSQESLEKSAGTGNSGGENKEMAASEPAKAAAPVEARVEEESARERKAESSLLGAVTAKQTDAEQILESKAQTSKAKNETVKGMSGIQAQEAKPSMKAFSSETVGRRANKDADESDENTDKTAMIGEQVEKNTAAMPKDMDFKKKITACAGTLPAESAASAKNFVLTAEGLNYAEASKLKYQFELCRIRHSVQRDFKINYNGQKQLIEYEPRGLSAVEGRFVACIEINLKQSLPKEVKTILIELKTVSKQDKNNY